MTPAGDVMRLVLIQTRLSWIPASPVQGDKLMLCDWTVTSPDSWDGVCMTLRHATVPRDVWQGRTKYACLGGQTSDECQRVRRATHSVAAASDPFHVNFAFKLLPF